MVDKGTVPKVYETVMQVRFPTKEGTFRTETILEMTTGSISADPNGIAAGETAILGVPERYLASSPVTVAKSLRSNVEPTAVYGNPIVIA